MMIIYDHVYTIYVYVVYVIYDYIYVYDYIQLYMIIYSTITYKLLNKKDIFPSKRVRFLFPCIHVVRSTGEGENRHAA